MGHNLLLIAISAGFVAIGVFALGDAPEALPGILFFGGCLLVGVLETVRGRWPVSPEITDARLALRYDRLRMGALGLASAAWAASGIVSLYTGMFPEFLAWLLIAFGGLGAVALLPAALDWRPAVIVDAEGIADRRSLRGKVPWADVSSVRSGTSLGVRTVEVSLVSAAAYAGARPLIGRLFMRGIDPIRIVDNGLDGSLYDILSAVGRFAPPHVHPQVPWGAYDDGDDDEDED